jgi:DNA repair photolyase
LIPGLNDSCVAEILSRARDAGAKEAMTVLLRLPAEVSPVFQERLLAAFPERAKRVLDALREMRGGKLYVSEWGTRMTGGGPRWDAIQQLFRLQCRRLGLSCEAHEDDASSHGDKPAAAAQGELF